MADIDSHALLAADVVENNFRTEKEYYHDDQRNPTDHGLKRSAITSALRLLSSHDMLRDGFPNFEKIGFEAQAFVDVVLDFGPTDTEEKEFRKEVLKDPHVVELYYVFGDVDYRCKVIGGSVQELEDSVTRLKNLAGVSHSKTSLVIDYTSEVPWRKRMGELIRSNSARVGEAIRRAKA